LAVASATLSYVLVERPILGLKDRLGWWSGSRRPAPEPAVPVATATPRSD
jgi:peptidoglycan/LPS O-acetylase OafA/YrhL